MLKATTADVIIIGLGPAGMTAAIYCSRKGLKTLILGKDVGGQVAKTGPVENYLGFGQATGFELAKQFETHLASFKNIEKVENVQIKNIIKVKKQFQVVLNNGKKILAKAVIVCSGRNPRLLRVPGELEYRNKGVSYCQVCDAPLFKNKVVAVIGAGNSALEAAISLASLCPQVYIINLNAKLGGDVVSQNKLKLLLNVRVINNAQTLAILGKQFVTGLKYKNTQTDNILTLDVQGAFIEIGWEPAVAFAKLIKKDKWQQIVIDKQCKTNVPGIFAAGDVTDVGYYQIIVAAGEGAKAALSAYTYLSHTK